MQDTRWDVTDRHTEHEWIFFFLLLVIMELMEINTQMSSNVTFFPLCSKENRRRRDHTTREQKVVRHLVC